MMGCAVAGSRCKEGAGLAPARVPMMSNSAFHAGTRRRPAGIPAGILEIVLHCCTWPCALILAVVSLFLRMVRWLACRLFGLSLKTLLLTVAVAGIILTAATLILYWYSVKVLLTL